MNGQIKQIASRQSQLDNIFEKLNDRMENVEITSSGVDYRSKAHWSKIEKLEVDVQDLYLKK